MNHNVSIIRSDMKFLGNKSDYKYAEQMKSHETHNTGANIRKSGLSKGASVVLISVCVCLRGRQ